MVPGKEKDILLYSYHLKDNKEVFDAELYAITGALAIALEKVRAVDPTLPNDDAMSPGSDKQMKQIRRIVIFTDAQTALKRCRHDAPRPKQCLAIRAGQRFRAQSDLGFLVILRWVPGYANVLGNEIADRVAKAAALNTTPTDFADMVKHGKPPC